MPISTKRPQIVVSERGSTRVPDACSRALAPRRCHRAQQLVWPRLDRVRPECRAANATGSPQVNRNQLTAAQITKPQIQPAVLSTFLAMTCQLPLPSMYEPNVSVSGCWPTPPASAFFAPGQYAVLWPTAPDVTQWASPVMTS